MKTKNLVYENSFSKESDISNFILEGSAKISFPNRRMRMENIIDPKEGQKANFVFWCKQDMPPSFQAEWDFYPIEEPGLAMFFFSAKGRNGEDLFSTHLKKREGEYHTYHSSDINAYHISYFRRKAIEERAFQTCNLRKSYGFNLVEQGADPIPTIADCIPPYHICVYKKNNVIEFYINELKIFAFHDNGKDYGEVLQEGKMGFRQMAPLIAEYANFKVFELSDTCS